MKRVESDDEDSGAEDKSTHEEDDKMPVETDQVTLSARTTQPYELSS